ncbi:MAG TPA: lipoyl synthase [Victivallales bacterium]|nr:lipoyl synthase [Victivallales bacterium]HPO91716.1 lipoyl synthase [Victivallales bacterium]HRR28137.1 lipoyl synthase [Victivallales bacterium]HRU00302.1 lipoyl synthase [Victivallales bacterium]
MEKNKKQRIPEWIRVKFSAGGEKEKVFNIIKSKGLHTVCSSAKCPNLGECWCRGTATFMILGDQCTRNCLFCAVKHSKKPPPPNPSEAEKIAEAVMELNLRHVVITSVTRDDLPDGGAAIFAKTTLAIKKKSPDVKVELLIPDFKGNTDALKIVLDAEPDILNHNLETVRRLTPIIRSSADYDRSLKVLSDTFSISKGKIKVKSGIMLGLGEEDCEIAETICDIRKNGATMLTIGQYLRPGANNIKISKFIEPDKFKYWKKFAIELNFMSVWSGPLVRSSYMAEEQNCK